MVRTLQLLALLALAAVSVSAEQAPGAPLDPFMGDWQGIVKTAEGEKPLCAQVICWGKEGYQANLLRAFDVREEPLAVLRGQADGAGVSFGDRAKIADGAFTGTLEGALAGAFSLKHVVRLSPTMGLKPPAGAIVLMGGGNLEEWQPTGDAPFVVDLAKAIGGDNRAAYLRCRITAPKAGPARLDVGSDDGVKAWLNGKVVLANNTPRGVTPWEDKVDVDLAEGPNDLMLKVLQGGGGWAACARVVGRDGKALDGLKVAPAPQPPVPAPQAGDAGAILTWELSGPYSEEGKVGPQALFDVAFAPEEPAKGEAQWRVVNDKPAPPKQWKLVEGGAAEVTPGAGSLVLRRQLTDHRIHLEFRSPFMPDARGQGRGNSGVYVQGRYEVQVLDSYGLKGEDNECGGFYKHAQPRVNMCAPPGQWQTYDIEFKAGRYNEATKRMDDAVMTVRHNGVLIHENLAITVDEPGRPGYLQAGPLLLQDHGNQVQYRNIWVVEAR